jgi:TatD DNase family protein
MRIARTLKLPVIIHCRDAYDDTLNILAEEKVQEVGGVMHCWAGTVEDARRTVSLGMHLGFGGTITYKTADNVREALTTIPIESVLIETDAPYLSPVPHRGKRNEPAYAKIVAASAATLRGVPFEELTEITTANALRCFPNLI